MLPTAIDGPVTQVDSTPLTKQLGLVRWEYDTTYGWRKYRYIKNTSGSTLSIGLGAMSKDSASDYQAALSGVGASRVRMLGVAHVAIANNYGGWVVCDGYALCQSNGSTSANTAQKPVANGQFADGAVGTDDLPVFATGAQAVAGATFVGKVMCP